MDLLDYFELRYSSFVYKSKIETEGDRYRIQISGVNKCDWWFLHIDPKNSVKTSRYLVWKKFGFCLPHTSLDKREKLLKGELHP